MRVALYTLGCKVNSYETDKIRETFQSKGAAIVSFTEPADVYVVNTCTVTQMAAKKSRQILHRARRLNPEALIVATGCFVQAGGEGMPEGAVDLYVSNADKSQLVQRVYDVMQDRTMLSDSVQAAEEGTKGHTRAFLKIQDGCRQYCSYCIIPYVRGPLQSREPEDVLAEVRHLVSQGYKELVLTGIHLSSYGRQGTLADPNAQITLGQLIQRLNEVEGLARIRQLAEENDVHTIVLGLPKNMNNTLGERAEKTLAFKRRLERDLYQVEILLWDERLSTRMAEKPLLERGLDRHKRKQVVDQIAAVYILQGYLDARKTQGENEESIR